MTTSGADAPDELLEGREPVDLVLLPLSSRPEGVRPVTRQVVEEMLRSRGVLGATLDGVTLGVRAVTFARIIIDEQGRVLHAVDGEVRPGMDVLHLATALAHHSGDGVLLEDGTLALPDGTFGDWTDAPWAHLDACTVIGWRTAPGNELVKRDIAQAAGTSLLTLPCGPWTLLAAPAGTVAHHRFGDVSVRPAPAGEVLDLDTIPFLPRERPLVAVTRAGETRAFLYVTSGLRAGGVVARWSPAAVPVPHPCDDTSEVATLTGLLAAPQLDIEGDRRGIDAETVETLSTLSASDVVGGEVLARLSALLGFPELAASLVENAQPDTWPHPWPDGGSQVSPRWTWRAAFAASVRQDEERWFEGEGWLPRTRRFLRDHPGALAAAAVLYYLVAAALLVPAILDLAGVLTRGEVPFLLVCGAIVLASAECVRRMAVRRFRERARLPGRGDARD